MHGSMTATFVTLLHTELQHIRSFVSGSSTIFQSLARNAGTFVPCSSTECILTVLNLTENFSLKINALGKVCKQHNKHSNHTTSSPLRSTYVPSVIFTGHLVSHRDKWVGWRASGLKRHLFTRLSSMSSVLAVHIWGVTKDPCSRTTINPRIS
jgi:hypothetical protein